MWLVFKRKMFDDAHVARILQLAKYAERYCEDKGTLNEIIIHAARACFNAKNPKFKQNALDFYEKLYVLDKSNMQNLKLLAQAYENVKDGENAKKAWGKYLERAPIGEETENIKRKLQSLDSLEPDAQEGFLDKLMSFFARR